MRLEPVLHILRQSWNSWLGSDPHATGPAWLKIVWTMVFCVVWAVFFTLLGFALDSDSAARWGTVSDWWHWFRMNLVISFCIGFSIRSLFAIGHRVLGLQRLQSLSGVARLLYFNALPIAGVFIGSMVGVALAG